MEIPEAALKAIAVLRVQQAREPYGPDTREELQAALPALREQWEREYDEATQELATELAQERHAYGELRRVTAEAETALEGLPAPAAVARLRLTKERDRIHQELTA